MDLAQIIDRPAVSAAAAAFYLFVLALCAPAARRTLLPFLSMPGSAGGTHAGVWDGIRGLAATWVFVFHAWQWTRPVFDPVLSWLPAARDGTSAVAVFVGLSGMLIHRSLRLGGGAGWIGGYAARRAARIYPLYTAAALASLAWFHPDGLTAGRVFAELSMFPGVGTAGLANPLAWSVHVEVLFYILLPIYLWAVGRRVVPTTALLFLALALTADGAIAHRSLELWKFFCVGILVAEALDVWGGSIGSARAASCFFAGWALVAAVYAKHDMHRQLILAVGIGLLLFGAATWRPAGRVLGAPPLRILGTISYSLFLCHGLVIAAAFPSVGFDDTGILTKTGGVDAPVGPWFLPLVLLPAALSTSALSFVLVERPFLTAVRRIPRSKNGGQPARIGAA